MSVWWLTQALAELPAADDWLAPAERARLAGLHAPGRRADWLLGRWTAKRVLGPRLGAAREPLAPGRLEITAAGDGAPEAFVDGRRAPWTVSLSHRAGRALCAVARDPAVLGCDLEVIEDRDPALVADFFAAPERALVDRVDAAARRWLIPLLWSAKESALKALRTGLRDDPRDVVVALVPGAAAGWHPLQVRHTETGAALAGWWRPADRFVLTIVDTAGRDA